jgi:hypothetical protein
MLQPLQCNLLRNNVLSLCETYVGGSGANDRKPLNLLQRNNSFITLALSKYFYEECCLITWFYWYKIILVNVKIRYTPQTEKIHIPDLQPLANVPSLCEFIAKQWKFYEVCSFKKRIFHKLIFCVGANVCRYDILPSWLLSVWKMWPTFYTGPETGPIFLCVVGYSVTVSGRWPEASLAIQITVIFLTFATLGYLKWSEGKLCSNIYTGFGHSWT